MRFTERIREALKTLTTGRVREVEVGAVDADDHLYRPLTGANAKDLSPLKHEQGIKVARFLFTANPLAHRLTDGERRGKAGDDLGLRREVVAQDHVTASTNRLATVL